MLKETWVNTYATAFAEEVVTLDRIERTSDGMRHDLNGRYVVIPLHVRRNQGIGSRPEGAVLPQPGSQGYAGTQVRVKTQYGVGQLTAHVLKLVDGDPRAAVTALDSELEGLKNDVVKDYNRQVYGDGTGALTTVTSVAGNVVTVASTQFMSPDMLIDAVAPAGPTVTASTRRILSVDDAAKTVTLDSAAGVAGTNVLVRQGNYNQELTGFAAFVSATSTVQNLSPAAEPLWAATVFNAAAHAYSDSEVTKAFDRVRRSAGGGKEPTDMFTDDGVERAVFDTLSAGREFHNTVEFGHGYSALPFSRGSKIVPIITDPDYPTAIDATTGSILGINEGDVKVFREDEAGTSQRRPAPCSSRHPTAQTRGNSDCGSSRSSGSSSATPTSRSTTLTGTSNG